MYSQGGREIRATANPARHQTMTSLVAQALPELDEAARRRRAAVVQIIGSSHGWACFKDYWGMDTDEAARAAEEAIAILLGKMPAAPKIEAEEKGPGHLILNRVKLDMVKRGDMLSVPWVVPPRGPVGDAAPNPNNGHCIPAVAYDARNLYVVTWGALKSMSWQFYRVYAEEAYAVLSKDFVERSGRTIAGFDLATLEEDLAKIPHLTSPVRAA